jgi:hypothetical protein
MDYWWESQKEIGNYQDQDVCGWIMDHKEIGLDSTEWIDLTQDRGWWRALMNTV